MKRCCILPAMLILLAAGQAQVIAAQTGIDQPAGEIETATAPASLPGDSTVPPETQPSQEPRHADSNGVALGELILLAIGASLFALIFWRGWHRLRDAPGRPIAFSTIHALLLLIGMFIAARLGALVAVMLLGIQAPADGPVPELTLRQAGLIQLGVYGGQFVVVAIYLWLRSNAPSHVDGRMSRAKAAVLAALTLLLVWPMALGATTIVGHLTGRPTDPIAHDLLQKLVSSEPDVWYALVVGLAVVVAPIFEEITYRGILQNGLVDTGVPRWLAIAFTSAMFAMMHLQSVDLHAIAALFVLSLGFGYVYEKTGRLTAPIVMHVLFNAGNVVMSYFVAGS